MLFNRKGIKPVSKVRKYQFGGMFSNAPSNINFGTDTNYYYQGWAPIPVHPIEPLAAPEIKKVDKTAALGLPDDEKLITDKLQGKALHGDMRVFMSQRQAMRQGIEQKLATYGEAYLTNGYAADIAKYETTIQTMVNALINDHDTAKKNAEDAKKAGNNFVLNGNNIMVPMATGGMQSVNIDEYAKALSTGEITDINLVTGSNWFNTVNQSVQSPQDINSGKHVAYNRVNQYDISEVEKLVNTALTSTGVVKYGESSIDGNQLQNIFAKTVNTSDKSMSSNYQQVLQATQSLLNGLGQDGKNTIGSAGITQLLQGYPVTLAQYNTDKKSPGANIAEQTTYAFDRKTGLVEKVVLDEKGKKSVSQIKVSDFKNEYIHGYIVNAVAKGKDYTINTKFDAKANPNAISKGDEKKEVGQITRFQQKFAEMSMEVTQTIGPNGVLIYGTVDLSNLTEYQAIDENGNMNPKGLKQINNNWGIDDKLKEYGINVLSVLPMVDAKGSKGIITTRLTKAGSDKDFDVYEVVYDALKSSGNQNMDQKTLQRKASEYAQQIHTSYTNYLLEVRKLKAENKLDEDSDKNLRSKLVSDLNSISPAVRNVLSSYNLDTSVIVYAPKSYITISAADADKFDNAKANIAYNMTPITESSHPDIYRKIQIASKGTSANPLPILIYEVPLYSSNLTEIQKDLQDKKLNIFGITTTLPGYQMGGAIEIEQEHTNDSDNLLGKVNKFLETNMLSYLSGDLDKLL